MILSASAKEVFFAGVYRRFGFCVRNKHNYQYLWMSLCLPFYQQNFLIAVLNRSVSSVGYCQNKGLPIKSIFMRTVSQHHVSV
jgi:hypothetical protein